MDPVELLEEEELLRFFRRRKTELSLLHPPLILLCRLRDYCLIPEDRYRELSSETSRQRQVSAVYDLLDFLEQRRLVSSFWHCVLQEPIMGHYPALRAMQRSLLEASLHHNTEGAEKEERKDGGKESKEGGKEKERKDGRGGKQPPEDKERKPTAAKKRKRRSCEEEAGPSVQPSLTPTRKTKKLHYSASPLKRGQREPIWTWPLYKLQLPVTCGKKTGTLKRDRLAEGGRCILSENRWFTPSEFEKFSGKQSSRNWKKSIYCAGTPLSKLLQEGHLTAANFKSRPKEVKKSLFALPPPTTDGEEEEGEEEEEEEEEEEAAQPSRWSRRRAAAAEEEQDEVQEEDQEEEQEQQQEEDQEEKQEEQQADLSRSRVFRVSCGDLTGVLHERRFASGCCGRSIRTESSWMSPEEFTRAALGPEAVSWTRDVTYEGRPLKDLLQTRGLVPHSVQCPCPLCRPTEEELENQRNDDVCCVCKAEGEEEQLVQCDQCPRSFHQTCHLPAILDDILRCEDWWICTFCIFGSLEELRYSDVENEEQTVLRSQISDNLLEVQYLLLTMCDADEEQIFTLDPRLHVKDYSSFISTPMWLCKVAGKLQRGEYSTVGEFHTDMNLIFSNSSTFNQNNREFLVLGERLKTLYEEEFQKAFHICH